MSDLAISNAEDDSLSGVYDVRSRDTVKRRWHCLGQFVPISILSESSPDLHLVITVVDITNRTQGDENEFRRSLLVAARSVAFGSEKSLRTECATPGDPPSQLVTRSSLHRDTS